MKEGGQGNWAAGHGRAEAYPVIIPLDEIGDEPVGGKALGLKLLHDLGLQIPDGFVILHPESGLIDQAVLQPHLARLGDGPKAVRSSAVCEDGQEASFAGQFETMLDISGPAAIVEAVHACISAASAERVSHYSRHRIAGADLRISVIVQNMIPAKAAGVLFSADPVSHRRDKFILDAVEGTGEGLVSGTRDPCHYEVFRSGSNLEKAIRSNGHLLTAPQVLELLEGAKRVEQAMGVAVDLEWAIDPAGTVHWLQARPVTTLSEVHFNELDTVKGSSTDVWTLGNIGEMMPGVTTPLTYSVVVDSIDYGMTVLADRAGACKLRNRTGYRYIQMFYNRLFINLTSMMEYARYAWLNKAENIQIALSVAVHPEIRETGKAPLPLRIYNFIRQSATVIRAASHLKELHRIADHFQIDVSLPLAGLYQEIDRKKFMVSLAFGHHMITSGQSGTLYSAFMGILTGDKRLPGAADHHLATILLSRIPHIESADAVKSLESFSRLIHEHDAFATRFASATSEEGLRMIREASPPEIAQLYQEFILRHGHRCVRESELREQPWEENQKHLIQLLQLKARFGDVEHHTFDVQEEIRNTLRKLPFRKRILFRLLLPTARKAVARREISKSLAIRMVNELRKGYRTLAEKLVDTRDRIPDAGLSAGLLDDTDQIYFLTHEEIGNLIATGDRSLTEKAARRRVLLPETDNLRFPEVCFGIPEPMEERVVPERRPGQLSGTPVSSGKVRAPVRIIHSLDDASMLLKGEIMVASFTDIGWSPFFSIVSGLITEIGSPLSHGAVVAREYGIPAVVGVKGAMTWLRDGDPVLLDGDLGLVVKEEGEGKSVPGRE